MTLQSGYAVQPQNHERPFARAAVQGRAAGRTRIGGLAVTQNGGKQIRQNFLLFRKKSIERFLALGDGFKA